MQSSLKPKIKPPFGIFPVIQETVRSFGLKTVCQESHCPNQSECWSGGTATFMVLGEVCTRACKFCHVKTFYKGQPLDPDEPAKLSQAIQKWGLEYVVLTSVDRDDLPDQGASHFASCIREIKKANPGILVEVLIPDFQGQNKCLETVLKAKPDVLAHNLETVNRLQRSVRDPRAGYQQSLAVLNAAKKLGARITKSSIMLGFGEQDQEVLEAMHDLRRAGVDILTLGQYLQPSQQHLPVKEFVSQEKWDFFRCWGEEIGFLYVASGPLVRSSYRAGELFLKNVLKR